MKCLVLNCEEEVKLPFCIEHWLKIPDIRKLELKRLYRKPGIETLEYQELLIRVIEAYLSDSRDSREDIIKRVNEYIRIETNKKRLNEQKINKSYIHYRN
jgi:hypothetical protein